MLPMLGVLVSVAVVVGIYVLYLRAQRESFEEALQVSCLLCDSRDVDLLSQGGQDRYRCGRCGYHTDLAERPDTAPLVETFRDLKRAVEYLYEAQAILGSSSTDALAQRLVGSDFHDEQVAEANRLRSNGVSLLQGLAQRHPELLNIPTVGESSDATVRWSDLLPDIAGASISLLASQWPSGSTAERKRFDDWLRALHHFRVEYAQYIVRRGAASGVAP